MIEVTAAAVSAFIVGAAVGFMSRRTRKKKSKDRVEVFPGTNEFYWHKQAPNNNIIATGGEGFETLQNALKAAFRANPEVKEVYVRDKAFQWTTFPRED